MAKLSIYKYIRTVYRHRFGSLIRAYELIGYTPVRDYRYSLLV